MCGTDLSVCWGSTMHEIPASDSFARPLKKGFLLKLTGRGWLYSGTWKSRYCVLDGSKFYFYESEHSKGTEKSCGVINLDYYDVCEENSEKDKRQPYVFVIETSVRGFFDNRHQFASESRDKLAAWIRAVQEATAETRANRRKAGRKSHSQDGKSPNLSNTSSQDSGEVASTSCLVNATKDRARGPQGRRLPQRKSMAPPARSTEDNDLRQRSISVSTPLPEDENQSSPRVQSPSDSKWLSLSMEEMDRGDDGSMQSQRSSSAFDIAQQKLDPNADAQQKKKPGAKVGKLGGQHAALTKELEMKLKAGIAPGVRRLPSQDEDEHEDRDEVVARKLDSLESKVNLTKDGLGTLEKQVNVLSNRVQTSSDQNDQAKTDFRNLMDQVTSTLKEAERITAECKVAISEANKSRMEYLLLAEECKETLSKLRRETEPDENENSPSV